MILAMAPPVAHISGLSLGAASIRLVGIRNCQKGRQENYHGQNAKQNFARGYKFAEVVGMVSDERGKHRVAHEVNRQDCQNGAHEVSFGSNDPNFTRSLKKIKFVWGRVFHARLPTLNGGAVSQITPSTFS